MKIVKSDKKIDELYEKYKYNELYILVDENKTIGFATINKDLNNFVWIYIKEEYRGNGYGKILFKEILNVVKDLGYNEFKVYVDKKNMQMVKIVNDFDGFAISSDNFINHYVFKLI